MKKQQNHTKPKGKSTTQGRKEQDNKKNQRVNFVKSKGTDKLETFANKSSLDHFNQVKMLKRNGQNNSRPSTSQSQNNGHPLQGLSE
ncbi:hypothetical protein Hanom_Chr13g01185801 [Helianthus anomalus]